MLATSAPAPADTTDTFEHGDLKAKVVTIGDVSVGKTCLLRGLAGKGFSVQESTLSVGFFKLLLAKDAKKQRPRMHLDLWDTAGQERFAPLISCYLRSAEVILLVYNPHNTDSFQALDKWLKKAEDLASCSPSLYLVATHADLEQTEGTVKAERHKALLEAWKARGLKNVGIMPDSYHVSAKTGAGIDALKGAVASHVVERFRRRNQGRCKVSAQGAFALNNGAHAYHQAGNDTPGCCS